MRTLLIVVALTAVCLLSSDLYAQGCQGGCNLNARQDVNPTPVPRSTVLQDLAMQTEGVIGWTRPIVAERADVNPFKTAALSTADEEVATIFPRRQADPQVINGKDGKDGSPGQDGADGKDGVSLDEVIDAIKNDPALTHDHAELNATLQSINVALQQISTQVNNNTVAINELKENPATPGTFDPVEIVVEVIPYQ